MFYKTSIRPEEEPIQINPEDKRTLIDENQWVYDEYVTLRTELSKASDPLDSYLEIYKKYENECKLSVVDYIKSKDKDDDEAVDINDLKKDIYKHFEEER